MKSLKRSHKKKGFAVYVTFGLVSLMSVAAMNYMQSADQTVKLSLRRYEEVRTTHLCEAGFNNLALNRWKTFKNVQTFFDLDTLCASASEASPAGSLSGSVPDVGNYTAGIIAYSTPNGDTYRRLLTVRVIGWHDRDGNGTLSASDPQKTVDVRLLLSLARYAGFDNVYFANNYGWMEGFHQNDLIINGDVRANGNFDFLSGLPTVNGTITAVNNDKLIPGSSGRINTGPVKWDDALYRANYDALSDSLKQRVRMPYDPLKHGAVGSAEFEKWRDIVFMSTASMVNNKVAGSGLHDLTGVRSWNRTSEAGAITTSVVDVTPSAEVVMPDLSNISTYATKSQIYLDTKATYADGTANPDFNRGAYLEVWNSSLNRYVRLDTAGVVNGSVTLVGTSTNPIKIHGPVTLYGDAVIKGYVKGQGTLYAQRNVHVVGDIISKTPPDFRFTATRTTMEQIDNYNEKADMLGLAASQSIIMGNCSTFSDPYPLYYMKPPFTKARLDDNGNLVPAYDATQIDAWGRPKYKSLVADATINGLASSGVNQIDAVMYTNFVGGGNIGTGGSGIKINGTIISRDEAMVCWSLPVRMNYDHRIRERTISRQPLIDLQLPRSPMMMRATWQDRGFAFSG